MRRHDDRNLMELSELMDKIGTELATDTSAQISADSELLMSGIIDSLGVINLVTWLEDQASVEIDPGDVVIENFETPTAILAFVASLQTARA